LTPRAHWRVYMQSGLSQRDGARRAERHAQATFIAAIRVHDSYTEGCRTRHPARRYDHV